MLKKNILFFTLFLFPVSRVLAQCAMCRAQLESMDDTSMAESVNDGIVYLMAVPYIAVLVFGLFWYLQNKKTNA